MSNSRKVSSRSYAETANLSRADKGTVGKCYPVRMRIEVLFQNWAGAQEKHLDQWLGYQILRETEARRNKQD